MTKHTKFLIKLARRAAKMVTPNFVVRAKDNQGDLVTNFDIEIEKFIIQKLKIQYPNFDIVSEESNSGAQLTPNCFTVDPIDGTINFANGLPTWGIMIGMIENSQTVSAVIYCPKLGTMTYADAEGAFTNGKPIHVNDKPFGKGIIETDLRFLEPEHQSDTGLMRNFRKNYSCAVSLSWIACGAMSGLMLKCKASKMGGDWDRIPGQYIVERAGGVTYHSDTIFAAANNQKTLDALLSLSKPTHKK
jgi:myo-inositol-1(or 4)-monophosphatase